MHSNKIKIIIMGMISAILIIVLLVGISSIFITPQPITNIIGPKENVSIAVTGDVMFARKIPGVLSSTSSPFKGVSNVTSNVDLLLINFENAATTSGNAVKGDVPLKCSPNYVPLAKANNRTIASLANNHAFDYGITGMDDTINNLKNANITPIGAGNNEKDAHKAVSFDIKDRHITILNYMDYDNFKEYSYDVMPYANGSHPGYSAYNSDDAKNQISNARSDSDLILVYMHFGNEYSRSPNDNQIKIAHELIDYGADIVLGSHPHVTQGIEVYNNKPIFYSLGNFIFDQSNPNTHTAYFVQIDLVNNTGECTVYPIYISNYLPKFMDSQTGTNLLNSLSPKAEEMEIENGQGKLRFNLNT